MKRNWTDDELIEYFILVPMERQLIGEIYCIIFILIPVSLAFINKLDNIFAF